MGQADDDFLERLRATFRAEVQEHVEAISAKLLEFERTSAPEHRSELVDGMFREAHSLKGAAGVADAAAIARVCQDVESLLSSWKKNDAAPNPDGIDFISNALDTVLALADAFGHPVPQEEETAAVAESATTRPADPTVLPTPTASETMIRVAESRIDELLVVAEELLAAKIAAAQNVAMAQELATEVAVWRKHWSAAYSALPAIDRMAARDINAAVELLNRAGTFTTMVAKRTAELAERARHDRMTVDPLVDDLIAQAGQVAMLPFSSIAGMLPKTVRDLARQQDKLADAIVVGGDVELDRRVLEQLKDPLVHAIRNAVSHGIEPPDERQRLGKNPIGTISIRVSPEEGGRVSVAVADDGRGLDMAGLRASALRAGFGPSDTDDRDMSLSAFALGVTTSPDVTDVSGRGVGLSVVREKISQLEGTVDFDYTAGAGATLRIVVPTTRATIHGVVVEVSRRPYVVPTARLHGVFRIAKDAILRAAESPTVVLDGHAVPLMQLASVLGMPTPKPDGNELPTTVMVIGSGSERIAFVVDRVVGEQSIIVKSLGPQLSAMQEISGATVLATGQVALVLDPQGVLAAARAMTSVASRYPIPSAADDIEIDEGKGASLVLVVEDSVTSRMMLDNILTAAGFKVRTAVDGADALTKLASEPFDAVVTDVQMPNLDGFELTAAVRSEKTLAHLPVVIVTALESPAEKARGLEVGADAYLCKQGFDQSNLVRTLRGLI